MDKGCLNSKRTVWTLISIIIIVPIGLCSKFYQGPAANWVNNSLGGVFYEIFWCIIVYLFYGKMSPWKIATVIFIITCMLEFLQLWHPSFLEFLKSYFVGRALLGNSFNWFDFPYYIIGCGIGWLWMTGLNILLKHRNSSK